MAKRKWGKKIESTDEALEKAEEVSQELSKPKREKNGVIKSKYEDHPKFQKYKKGSDLE